jgi:hypothetical protein
MSRQWPGHKNTKYIALVGDFNSKTSTLEGLIIPDQNLFQLLAFSENDELIKRFV